MTTKKSIYFISNYLFIITNGGIMHPHHTYSDILKYKTHVECKSLLT